VLDVLEDDDVDGVVGFAMEEAVMVVRRRRRRIRCSAVGFGLVRGGGGGGGTATLSSFADSDLDFLEELPRLVLDDDGGGGGGGGGGVGCRLDLRPVRVGDVAATGVVASDADAALAGGGSSS